MPHDRGVTDHAFDTGPDPDEPFVDPAASVGPGPQPIGYDEFGMRFMDLVLHRDRVMESVNRVLGEEFHLGPIGAGPGRKVAKVTASDEPPA